jgi:nucleotide-binding universal stress UspA family protein
MFAIKTILHPTDFGDSSQLALELACGLAADYDSHLVILHVVPAPFFLDGVLAMPGWSDNGVREELDDLKVPGKDIDVSRRIERGNPAAEILDMAQLCGADLIVMGSHGRRGLRRWFMGSVAEAVTRSAVCPVLTVSAHCDKQAPDAASFQSAAPAP